MKKLFLTLVCLLFSLALVRSLHGNEPMRLSGFLKLFSEVDIDFSHTVETISSLGEKIQPPSVRRPGFFTGSFVTDVLKALKEYFYYLINLFASPVELITDILYDILEFLKSVFSFFRALVGI